MKKSLLATLTVGMLTLAACQSMPNMSENTMNISNKNKAIDLLNSIETGDKEAVRFVNPNKYTQHNLAVGDGLNGFGEVLHALPKNSAKVDIVRAFSDGDYVFTHTDYNFFGPKVGFDVFKFEQGLIVEHWDNLAEKSVTNNPSNRSQLDGSTKIEDLDKTDANKVLVAQFVQTILVNGQYDKLGKFFNGDTYYQHNTMVGDGVSGLKHALEAMAEQGIYMVYNKNHKILGEGNFVLSISEGTFAGKPTSFYDLFRVENGKIAEHWDVMESIIPKDQWKNNNGKFGHL